METLKKLGRNVFIFVLIIRNNSLYSGKITIYFNIGRMSLNLLATFSKKNRDSTHRGQSTFNEDAPLKQTISSEISDIHSTKHGLDSEYTLVFPDGSR